MTEPRRLGRYRLVRRLAVGGVAEVYLAVAEGLSGFEKRVVVKRLMPEHGRDPELLSMFLDEARLMALLHHPQITEVYDIGAQDGEYFFALEHVDGCDLRDLLEGQRGEPLPLAAALTIVAAVADGLEHAHGQRSEDGSLLGVVHRDVTPSNVLCGRQGEIKLADFGVAKWAAQRSRTEQGTIKGKLSYMSPEQCRAEPLDRRSDVFALGVILYELTTGQKPFVGESEFEALSAIVAGRTTPPSKRRADYPVALEGVVSRALCTERAGRFGTAGEMREAVSGVAAELGVALGPAPVAELVQARLAAQARRGEGADGGVSGAGAPEGGRGIARGRTATDLAVGATPAAPGAGAGATEGTLSVALGPQPGPRTTWRSAVLGAAVLALVSVLAVAVAARSRTQPDLPLGRRAGPAGTVAASAPSIPGPAERGPTAGPGRQEAPAPERTVEGQSPPPATPGAREAPERSTGARTRREEPPGRRATAPTGRATAPARRATTPRPMPTPPAPTLQIWDPDSATLP